MEVAEIKIETVDSNPKAKVVDCGDFSNSNPIGTHLVGVKPIFKVPQIVLGVVCLVVNRREPADGVGMVDSHVPAVVVAVVHISGVHKQRLDKTGLVLLDLFPKIKQTDMVLLALSKQRTVFWEQRRLGLELVPSTMFIAVAIEIGVEMVPSTLFFATKLSTKQKMSGTGEEVRTHNTTYYSIVEPLEQRP